VKFSSRCSRFAALASLLFAGCVHSPRLKMPEQCSPMPDKVVCEEPGATFRFGAGGLSRDAGGFLCYRPEDIVPFLERCGER
jgi:hypothetical protein